MTIKTIEFIHQQLKLKEYKTHEVYKKFVHILDKKYDTCWFLNECSDNERAIYDDLQKDYYNSKEALEDFEQHHFNRVERLISTNI